MFTVPSWQAYCTGKPEIPHRSLDLFLQCSAYNEYKKNETLSDILLMKLTEKVWENVEQITVFLGSE